VDYRATILLYCELVFALGILWKEGLFRTTLQRFTVLTMVSLAFVLRYCCLTYETLDYQDWIRVWIDSLRQTGSWKGLGQAIWSCNYNVPYLYFLALIAKSSVSDLLLVKLLSILFDVLLAWCTMRLVGLFTQSPARRLTAFLGVLWLPTVYLNGALWGQCDVIYATFAVLSLYLMLSDRPCWSIAAIAVSLSFKLQAIFILPAYFLFLIAKRVKLWQLLIFPLTYVATLLPAVFAGRDFIELITLYYNNTSTIGDGLNYNSSSLYALLDFSSLSTDAAGRIGIVLAFFLCAGVYVWLLIRRDEITDRTLLAVSVLFCIGVPFLLPHMHDRYFFMADILTFALAIVAPTMSLTPVLVSFGSLLGYYAYLKTRYLMPMRYGGLAMLAALILTIGYTSFSLTPPKKVLTNTQDLV
jgi:Gpi18-like mannosyltransferase